MSTTTQRRSELRTEARRRERDVLPKLRTRVKAARQRKQKRLAKCREDCKAKRSQVKTQAAEARAKLRERLALAKERARDFCAVCKVSASGAELDRIDAALGALEQEREHIRQLRAQASGMVDPRGSAGGRRAAEIRAELESEVSRNLADDADLTALWDAQRDRYRRFAPTQRATMTERFLHWAETHPEALDELRARQDVAWEREAEELLTRWPRAQAIGDMSGPELANLARDHDTAAALLEQAELPPPGEFAPTADTLRFAELVHAAARDPKTKRFGKAKAYLRSVFNTMRRSGLAITWPRFRDAVIDAHRRSALVLSRADLVPAMDRKLVADSAVSHENATFHLVDVPGEVPF